MNKIIYITLFSLFFCSCEHVSQQKKIRPARMVFLLPEIPFCIVDSVEQMSYLAEHFWDHYAFKDTTFIHSSYGQNVFVRYLELLNRIPEKEASIDIGRMIEKSKVDSTVCMDIFLLAEKNLYDPNSPMKNETLYMKVLEKILFWGKLNRLYKTRPRCQYNLALKNRPGKLAADFTFIRADGKRHRLYEIKAGYVLLYFNNPGCGDCKRVGSLLTSSGVINGMIKNGKLKLLSIYPDKDLGEWKKAQGKVPVTWINGYDQEETITKENLYDLRAIPTIYLLDRNKRVILKDVRFEDLEILLSGINNHPNCL